MVLFHGINDTGFSYAGLALRLDNDFRMIIVDMPAYGNTFTAKPLDFSYASQTSRLRALLEAAGARKTASLIKLGYVSSFVPWVCLGVRWIGPRAKAGFFVTLELAPLLDKAFLFW